MAAEPDFHDRLAALLGQPAITWPPPDYRKSIPEYVSAGDWLLSIYSVKPNTAHFFTDVIESESWEPWLATMAPDALEPVIIAAHSLSINYRDQDRNLDKALYWAEVHVRLARSLPEDFGPRSSRIGHGKDHHVYVALAGLAKLEGQRGAVERAYGLLREAEAHYHAEKITRLRDGVTERPLAERLLAIGGGPEQLYRDLSRAAGQVGDNAETRRYHLHANDERNKAFTLDTKIDELMLRGEYLLDKGHPDAALGYLQDAVRLAETEQLHHHIVQITAHAYLRIAIAYRSLGVPRTALIMLGKARNLMTGSGKSGFLAGIDVLTARIFRMNPRLGVALDHYLRALEYYSTPAKTGAAHTWTTSDGRVLRVVDFEDGFGVLLAAAEILREEEKRNEATHFLRLATAIAEIVREGALDEVSRIAIQSQRSEALVALARIQLELARETGSPTFGDDAWQTIETLRARTFLDMVGDTALAPTIDVPTDLAGREVELLARRRQLRSAPGRDTEFWAAHEAIETELKQVWCSLAAVSPEASAVTG